MGTLAIIGLGLIGGSMGLALKRAEPENTEVIGYDRDVDVMIRAHQFGAIQRTTPTLADAAKEANIVIIATPTISVRKVMEEIAPHLRKGTVVTDTASTKGEVARWARETLPDGVFYVGGHPMAGKEKSGPQAAEETLFDGRPYIIVPSVTASEGAVNAVVGLAKAIGAEPSFLDADEHDSYAAAISHVPLVASIALFNLAKSSVAWPELASMSGPGFRDLTRLASGEPEMGHDIFLTNRSNIRHWLDRYIEQLQDIAKLIEDDEEGGSENLFKALVETQMARDDFLTSPPKHDSGLPDTELPGAGEAFMNMMAGTLWNQRAKEITGAIEEERKKRELEERMKRRVE